MVEEYSGGDVDAILKLPSVVLLFWTEWHAPSKALFPVFDQLASDTPNTKFFRVEAEQYASLTARFPQISAVPAAAVLRNGKCVVMSDDVAAASLVQLVQKNCANAMSAVDPQQKLQERLAKLVAASPVMLFMKGTPDSPRCGFSRQIVAILKEHGVVYGSFDILSDNEVRQGLKEFSNWPTYPQLYVNGKLLGGLDVIRELVEDEEFLDMIPQESRKSSLNKRLQQLVSQRRVMLFMKGSPDEPRCGFSRQMVALLSRHIDFKSGDVGTFDILSDNDVRQGLKEFSKWPTYPQLYVGGKLLGGLDVARELEEDEELADMLG
ncbi:MAG: hypothetical protein MHM6MM_004298 [Cercozoa sp. M6MM]